MPCLQRLIFKTLLLYSEMKRKKVKKHCFLLCILFYGLKLGENEPSFLLRYLTSGASFGNWNCLRFCFAPCDWVNLGDEL